MGNMDHDIQINNLLCFINSAKNDYSKETLKDVAFAFYSHEEIKAAKTLLCNLSKRDITWRRDPEKKRKDLTDVLDYHEELTSARHRWKFVCDSYKVMPPLGMEMIAPLLINLTSEVTKINECLPKVLDIKSEVVNTADTVRQMRVELSEVQKKFSSAISGIQDAADNISQEELSILNNIHTFRRSLGGNSARVGDEDFVMREALEGTNDVITVVNDLVDESQIDQAAAPPISAGVAEGGAVGVVADVRMEAALDTEISALVENSRRKSSKNATNSERSLTSQIAPVVDRSTGAVSKHRVNTAFSDALKSKKPLGAQAEKPKVMLSSTNVSGRLQNGRRNSSTLLRGMRKDGTSTFRAVKQTIDIFVGRVHKDTTEEDIMKYVHDTFDIDYVAAKQLQIQTDLYNAFKVTVCLSDRDKLFNSSLWPEDVVINKYYNRKKSNTTVN